VGTQVRDGEVVVAVTGTLTPEAAGDVQAAVRAAIADGARTVVVDVGGARRVDESGLALLLRCALFVRQVDGVLRIAGADVALRATVERSLLSDVLVIDPPVPAAAVLPVALPAP
jgi:anti-anti-sigma factor